MRALLFFIPATFFCQLAVAQANPFMKDVNGRPLYLRITYVAEGSPYWEDAYRAADITTSGNRTYSNIMTKVNLMENIVQFLSPGGVEMIATMPVKRIRFYGAAATESGNQVLESHGAINDAGARIYQVLDSGRISLLKHLKVVFRDDRRYNEATVTRVFTQTPVLYAYHDGREARVEKNREFLLRLFADKAKEVDHFISEKDVNLKSEKDLVQVFHFYNSLF
jgi:hypothetical protein